jgi:hypothetical protein
MGSENEVHADDTLQKYQDAIVHATLNPGDSRDMIEMLFKVSSRQHGLMPFRFNAVQREYWEARTSGDLVVKAAQLGISTVVFAEWFADAMVVPGLEILITAQRDETAKKLFTMMDTFRAGIPGPVAPTFTQDSAHILEFDHSAVEAGLTSAITVGSAESKTFGRGRPVHRALFTEVGFYEGETLQVIDGIVARMPVGNSRRVLESTANGQAGYLYETWNRAVSQRAGTLKDGDEPTDLTPHFFAWIMGEEYQIPFVEGSANPFERSLSALDDNEIWLMEGPLQVTRDQLRWRRWKISQIGKDRFKEEFPINADEAFLPVGTAVFDNLDAIERISHGVKQPIETRDSVDVWAVAVPGRSYVISIDQASGEQRDVNARPLDFQCITVWDAVTREQMARFKRRDVTARELAVRTADLYGLYNKALVTPESNLAQFGFMDWLREMGIENIYVHVLQNGIPKEGFPTTRFTKPAMKDNFKNILEAGACAIRSADMVREIRNYRWLVHKGKGAMGAPAGANDDELMTGFIAFMPEVLEQARLYSGVSDRQVSRFKTQSVSVHR